MSYYSEITISGYLHEFEATTQNNLHIPLEIQYIIIRFYFIKETFTDHGRCIRLNDKQTIAAIHEKVTLGTLYNTVFGKNMVRASNRYTYATCKWHLKLLKNAHRIYSLPITIGIDSTHSDYDMSKICNGDFTDRKLNKDIFYGFGMSGWIYDRLDSKRNPNFGPFNDDDELILILDMKERTLVCESNGCSFYVAKNVDVSKGLMYRLAVSMSRVNDSVQLLKFEMDIKLH